LCCYGSSTVTYKDESHIEHNTKEKFLKMAFLAKLEKTTDGLELQTMADKGAPNIHRYMNYTSNEGYIYIIIENRDQEAIYIEELEFDKFDKL